jgi:hypothetical protein
LSFLASLSINRVFEVSEVGLSLILLLLAEVSRKPLPRFSCMEMQIMFDYTTYTHPLVSLPTN